MIVYDIEPVNTNRVVAYGSSIYKLNKISGKYNRNTADQELEKCTKACFVFKSTNSINEMLDYVLEIPREVTRVK